MQITMTICVEGHEAKMAFEDYGDCINISLDRDAMSFIEHGTWHFTVSTLEWARLLEAGRGFLVERVNT